MLAKMLSGAGGASRPLPSFVSSSLNRVVSTTNTVTAPSGIQNGDLLIAITYSTTTAGITPPTGFTQIYNEQTANPFTTVNIKTAASESGNYTFTASTSVTNTVVMLVYRKATYVNTVGSINRASSGTSTALSITPTYSGTLLASLTCSSGSASIATPPAGMTQRASNATQGVAPVVAVYDLSGQTAAATGNKTLIWSANSTNSGLLLQITNEPTVVPAFVASSTAATGAGSTSLVISKPSSPSAVIEGDLMFAFMTNGANATWTGDTGWTEVADQGANPSIRVAYKVAGASEGSSYTFTSSASGTLAGGIVAYRYGAYDAIGALTEDTDPLILPSVSASLSQSILLAFGARNAGVTVGTPISMTSRISRSTAPSYNVCDQFIAKGPSGTRSMTTGSATNPAGIMLAIKPTRSL